MDLTNVKIGDKFMRPQSYGWGRGAAYYEIVQCESVSEKQCVIGGYKYRKSNGACIGNNVATMQYDKALYEEGQKFLRRKKVETFNYCTLSNEQCERIYKIIMEAKP